MVKSANILVVDDEQVMRDSCRQILEKEGYKVRLTDDGAEGLSAFKEESFHAVILDIRLPGMNGMEVLAQIKEESPETPVIIITGYASIESAVESIKHGAFEYLAKPFTPEELRVSVSKAIKSRRRYFESLYLHQELKRQSEFDMVVGISEGMKKVMDIVNQVSPADSTVLIIGESGTGKELIAKEIHNHSLRKSAPFVVVDCGALVETLFESELFGHVKGSFTGAYVTKHGRFEVANGGTIFLDEIGHISLNIQAKLLRVIQEREVTRIGSSKSIKVDVRILAATNEDLSQCVKEGRFREDLFYRLSVVPLHIPPLRERKEDIPLLVNHFLYKYNRRAKKQIVSINRDVLRALTQYDWPGNIRELENTIERAVVLSKGDKIELDSLIYHGISSRPSLLSPNDGRYKNLEEVESEYIRTILQAHHGNRSQTAKILGIDRKTLLNKIKKYDLK
jgi:two-component system response regulator HydG